MTTKTAACMFGSDVLSVKLPEEGKLGFTPTVRPRMRLQEASARSNRGCRALIASCIVLASGFSHSDRYLISMNTVRSRPGKYL
jgi:hypothetical protein